MGGKVAITIILTLMLSRVGVAQQNPASHDPIAQGLVPLRSAERAPETSSESSPPTNSVDNFMSESHILTPPDSPEEVKEIRWAGQYMDDFTGEENILVLSPRRSKPEEWRDGDSIL